MPNELYKELIKRISLIVDGHLTLPKEYFEEGAYSYSDRMAQLKSRNKPGKPENPDLEGILIEGNNIFIHDLIINAITSPDKLNDIINKLDLLINDDDEDEVTASTNIKYNSALRKSNNATKTTVATYNQDLISVKNQLSRDLAERWPMDKNGRFKYSLSVVELANILRVGKDAIYERINNGDLTGDKYGAKKGKTKFTFTHVINMTGLEKYLY